MSSLVGLILLLVFLTFALLMFLERLSALLALPLMALAFLVVALAADLAQPPRVTELVSEQSVDRFGRRHNTVAEQSHPSRYAQWQQFEIKADAFLREKTLGFAQLIEHVQAELDRPDHSSPAEIEQLLLDYRAAEAQLRNRARAELAELPDFLARPPHSPGRRSDFERRFDTIASDAEVRAIATALEDPADSANGLTQLNSAVSAAATAARQWRNQYDVTEDPGRLGFRISCAVGYLFQYIVFVLRVGSLHLHAAVIATIFGGMFAMYVKNLHVAERLIYWTAEFAGERTYVIALAIFLASALIFTSVGGLGTVIMLGAIILPILRSVGLGPIVAAGVLLISIAMGGTLHPVARRLWIDFYGIPANQLDSILWTMVGLYAACGVAWIRWGAQRRLRSSFQAEPNTAPARHTNVPARLMAAPLIPVALVYVGGVEEISAFTISIAYMYLCVCRRTGATRRLAKALIEGAQTVMPPALLMVGIGILITALSTPPVQAYLRPLLTAAVPESRWGYIVLFALAAPLALYRGPLNVWGMGLAVSATLLATSSLPPAAILCAILTAGMLQGICDPTNTANVWIAGFQGVSVNQILRYTIIPVWIAAIVGVVIFGFRFVGV